jgi:hypothetical protein
MALTAEQEQKICEYIDREDDQKKKSVLSSLENFARWVEVVAKIVVALNQLKPLFDLLCKLLLQL